MQCPGCHKTIADDSKFCQYCGVPIGLKDSAHGVDAPASATASMGGASAPLDPATEKPLREFRPAWRAYVRSWALWAVVAIVLMWLGFKFDDPVWWKVLWAVVAAAAAVVFIRQALAVLAIRYRLTTQRLFIDRGLFTRTTDQTELIRVDDVRVRQGVFDRLLNIGSVEVISTDATSKELVIRGVEDAATIAEDIRLHTRRVRSQRTLYVENV